MTARALTLDRDALTLDRDALTATQHAGDILRANDICMDAFYADVRADPRVNDGESVHGPDGQLLSCMITNTDVDDLVHIQTVSHNSEA